LLFPDHTWQPAPTASHAAATVRPKSATQPVKAPFGEFTVWIDPSKWTQKNNNETGRLSFVHRNGEAHALLISERLGLPNDALKDIVLTYAKSVSPDAHVTHEEKKIVSGHEVVCLKFEGTIKKIPFTYYGYYYGGSSGTVQLVTYTLTSAFERNEDEFNDFLNGLEITDSELKELPVASVPSEVSFNKSNMRLSYDPKKWRAKEPDAEGMIELTHTKGDAYVRIIPERIEIPTDDLVDIALSNAQESDPNAKMLSKTSVTVAGHNAVIAKTAGTNKGIHFIFYGLYYGGTEGTDQIIGYTGSSLFDEYKSDFDELLRGLRFNN